MFGYWTEHHELQLERNACLWFWLVFVSRFSWFEDKVAEWLFLYLFNFSIFYIACDYCFDYSTIIIKYRIFVIRVHEHCQLLLPDAHRIFFGSPANKLRIRWNEILNKCYYLLTNFCTVRSYYSLILCIILGLKIQLDAPSLRQYYTIIHFTNQFERNKCPRLWLSGFQV